MELVDKILIGRKLALMDTYLSQIREFFKVYLEGDSFTP